MHQRNSIYLIPKRQFVKVYRRVYNGPVHLGPSGMEIPFVERPPGYFKEFMDYAYLGVISSSYGLSRGSVYHLEGHDEGLYLDSKENLHHFRDYDEHWPGPGEIVALLPDRKNQIEYGGKEVPSVAMLREYQLEFKLDRLERLAQEHFRHLVRTRRGLEAVR